MAQKGLNVAVIGATGAVGREMIETLQQRRFPIASLKALASSRSAGTELEFGDASVIVEELKPECFAGIDIALFSAGSEVSSEFARHAVEAGCFMIDNSSRFRMDDKVLLIVPEVNGRKLRDSIAALPVKQGMIIANPNCTTIELVVVLKPLHDAAHLRRVVLSSYQAVSGAGKAGMDELWEQSLAVFNQREIITKKFAHQIAFNCLPQIDAFLDNGYTKEEIKVVNESRKILDFPELRITCTAVRVPVMSCHSESVNIETQRKLTADQAREILHGSPGVVVLDNPQENLYPLAIDLAGTDATYVGRIREDDSIENGLNMWVVADNLRKGAALNAVQIAEIVLEQRFAGRM